MPFTGFPPETFTFLKGLKANNSKVWFEAHRGDYEQFHLAPAKAFVEAIAPGLKKISKDVHAEAKVNGSIFRINRDIRVREVQLIDHEGQNRGTTDILEALNLAEEAGLDLVEIVPNANPPVCKILDYGKFRFLEQKKAAEIAAIKRNCPNHSASKAITTPKEHAQKHPVIQTMDNKCRDYSKLLNF